MSRILHFSLCIFHFAFPSWLDLPSGAKVDKIIGLRAPRRGESTSF